MQQQQRIFAPAVKDQQGQARVLAAMAEQRA
jgi:hypothetical protein